MAAMQYNTQSERQYRCKFFTDENDFLELIQEKVPSQKPIVLNKITQKPIGLNSPFMEKNMFFSDVPVRGETILLSNNHRGKVNLYQIETVYRHFCNTDGGRALDVYIEYVVLMKQLYVATRIVMVEKHKAPIQTPVVPTPIRFDANGMINHVRDMRNHAYYYEDDDGGDIDLGAVEVFDDEDIDVNDNFAQMPF